MKQALIRILKGIAIGASMLVPGVSGGTMAIILGIYDELVHAISDLTRHFRKNAIMLLEVGAGGLIGICLLAKLLLQAVTAYEMPMMFLFLGAIAGTIPALIKKTNLKKPRPVHLVYFLIGFASVLLLSLLPENLFDFSKTGGWGFFILLFAGVVIAVALVLPGISASYVLLMLGIYDITLSAVTEFNLLFLSPLVLGVLAGVFLTTRILEKAMTQHPGATYLIIIGFVAGSMAEIFPGLPSGIQLLICVVTLAVGFFAIFFLSRRVAD